MTYDLQLTTDKYFDGETSLQEELALKKQLQTDISGNFAAEQKMFATFERAKEMRLNAAEFDRQFIAQIRRRNHRRTLHRVCISALSIAAATVSAVFIVNHTGMQGDAFVVEQGVRTDDVTQAYNYAAEAINDALLPLQQSMQSLNGLEGLLAPTHKLDNIIQY